MISNLKKFLFSIFFCFSFMTLHLMGNAHAADLPGLKPNLVPQTQTYTGYTVLVDNYDSAYTWRVTTSSGTATFSTVAKDPGPGNNGLITLTGVTGGTTPTITVTSTRTGYTTESSTYSTTIPLTPLPITPQLAIYAKSNYSFQVRITNYDSQYTWTATSTRGTATIDTYGYVTVSSLKWGQKSMVIVNVTKLGYTQTTSTLNGSTNPPPMNLTPILENINPQGDYFTVQISNFDDVYDWKVTPSAGSGDVSNSGLITVRGFNVKSPITFVVNASYDGTTTGETKSIGYGSLAALNLIPDIAPYVTKYSGFESIINNFNPDFTWRYTTNAGLIQIDSTTGKIVCNNVGPGTNFRVTIFARFWNGPENSTTFQAASYPLQGLSPKFGKIVSNQTGFKVPLSDTNEFYQYKFSSDVGTVSEIPGYGAQISDLKTGTSANVVVTILKDDVELKSISIDGKTLFKISLAVLPKTIASKKLAVVKKKTITCQKGSLKKFVTAPKPVCPSGYKQI